MEFISDKAEKNFIGIDLGTTSICGVSVSAETGAVIKKISADSNAFLKAGNEWERIQSPQKITALAKEILDSLTDEKTKAIGITGQMHGIVYTNKNGNAVSPLYTWQDLRGNLPVTETLRIFITGQIIYALPTLQAIAQYTIIWQWICANSNSRLFIQATPQAWAVMTF